MNRQTAFQLCGRLGVSDVLLMGTRCLAPIWLTVLAYHRVCEYNPTGSWDSSVISATPEAFPQQLAFIKRHFSPVTSEQVVAWKQGRFAMPRNPIVLTFDDGYRDCHDVALPLLRDAGVAADFFVCPWNIREKRLFWWDKIAFCLRRTRRKSIALTYPEQAKLELTTRESRRAALRTVHGVVRRTPKLDMQKFTGQLKERAEVDINEEREAEKLLMGWDQVRALRRAGMGIGSHSYSHPLLSLADDAKTREEMVRSKDAIEKELKERVLAFAYPVGCFNNGTKVFARQAGYEIAYSYCSGATFLRSADWFEVRRVTVERYMSLPYFRTMVAVPFLT